MTVRDYGTGLTPEVQDRMFQPFYTTKSDVGTGLGLWVVRNILEKCGGTIEAENANDGGAIITVQVPLAVPEAGTA